MTTPSYGTNTSFAGVPSQNVNIVNAAIDKTFSEAFQQATAESSPYMQVGTTRGKYINLAAMLQVGRVKPWTSSKVVKPTQALFSPIPMKPLQSSISIDKYDFMGDVIGLYGDAIRGLANQAAMFPDWNLANALQSGYAASYAGYWQGTDDDWGETGSIIGDNLPFFSSNHSWPGTSLTFSNVITGSLSNPQTYGLAVEQMQAFVGNEGQPLRVEPKGIIYAPNDEYSVFNALEAKFTNFNAPTAVAFDNVITRYGLKPHKLSTLYNDPGVAYMIGQVNGVDFAKCHMLEQLHLVPSVSPTDKSVFYDHEFIYSVEGYGRVVLPLPFLCIRISDPSIAKYV